MTDPSRGAGEAGEPTPLDRLLDVALYAPLGLALMAKDELPKLAAYGRQQLAGQSTLAHTLGKLAVDQGRRQAQAVVDRLLGRTGPPAESEVATMRRRPSSGRRVPGEDGRLPVVPPATTPDIPAAITVDPAGTADVDPTSLAVSAIPAASELPIPDYDSLSASQVVQRLPGLSPEELEAVRSYEQAGRGRKTILLRVAQLRTAS